MEPGRDRERIRASGLAEGGFVDVAIRFCSIARFHGLSLMLPYAVLT